MVEVRAPGFGEPRVRHGNALHRGGKLCSVVFQASRLAVVKDQVREGNRSRPIPGSTAIGSSRSSHRHLAAVMMSSVGENHVGVEFVLRIPLNWGPFKIVARNSGVCFNQYREDNAGSDSGIHTR